MWVFFIFVFISLLVMWAGITLMQAADPQAEKNKTLIIAAWFIIVIFVILAASFLFYNFVWKRYH